jgi:hypothetical protein
MTEYISYFDETGKITGTSYSQSATMQMIKALATVPFVDGNWFGKDVYVLNGAVVDRPINPTTVSGLALESVPVPATVIVNGVSYQTDDSFIEFDFNQPGTYAVKVVAWPYLDKEFSIENPA